MRLVTFALAGAAVLALAGCDGGEIVDGEIASVTIYGSVTTAASEPAAGAILKFWAFYTPDEGPPYAVDTADAAGSYRAQLTNWGTRYVVDVHIVAEGPDGSGLIPDTTLRESVVMAGDADSVLVDFVLQPAP